MWVRHCGYQQSQPMTPAKERLRFSEGLCHLPGTKRVAAGSLNIVIPDERGAPNRRTVCRDSPGGRARAIVGSRCRHATKD